MGAYTYSVYIMCKKSRATICLCACLTTAFGGKRLRPIQRDRTHFIVPLASRKNHIPKPAVPKL